MAMARHICNLCDIALDALLSCRPAQLQLCPPGGASPCSSTNYDSALPIMYPYAVNYTGGKYRGEVLFTQAQQPQPGMKHSQLCW